MPHTRSIRMLSGPYNHNTSVNNTSPQTPTLHSRTDSSHGQSSPRQHRQRQPQTHVPRRQPSPSKPPPIHQIHQPQQSRLTPSSLSHRHDPHRWPRTQTREDRPHVPLPRQLQWGQTCHGQPPMHTAQETKNGGAIGHLHHPWGGGDLGAYEVEGEVGSDGGGKGPKWDDASKSQGFDDGRYRIEALFLWLLLLVV